METRPRALTLPTTDVGPVRVVLVGGFLGAGKTTALAALARALAVGGRTTAFITNDQAPDLVDTVTLRHGSRGALPLVEEVSGGCFCCRFDALVDSIEWLLTAQRPPDVLLCEPVGSCTDMVATVLAPLRTYYPHTLVVAPFVVLVDPDRLDELPSLPESVRYLFEKQLEEAEYLALTKVDTLDTTRADALARGLAGRWRKPVLRLSSVRGDGVETLSQVLLHESSRSHALESIDYDLYAQGEAELGWLNASGIVRSLGAAFSGRAFLEDLLERLRIGFLAEGACVAHLKASLTGPTAVLRANLVRTEGQVSVSGTGDDGLDAANLIVNARIGVAPERLQQLVEAALSKSAAAAGATVDLTALRSFRPGYPTPPYRLVA